MQVNIAKWLILIGIGIIFLGGVFWLLTKMGLPLGNLPGDLRLQKEKCTIYFPIITSIVLSIILTIAINLIFWIFRK
ncbi:MAG: DUF2905 domain-containing protein [Chlamydiae bacterium]|nr:DUF2905 domain-containing protein [Chlamydiota bacterium]